MGIKILKNFFSTACILIVVLCLSGNAFGAPITYSATSFYLRAMVSGQGEFMQDDDVHVPGTATKFISTNNYYTQADATGAVNSFSLYGYCEELIDDSTYAEAMPYVVERYTFIAPSSDVIFTYNISYSELNDEDTLSRESYALMNWYIMGGGSTIESEHYNIYTPENITRSFTLTLTEGVEYVLHLSPHVYVSTLGYTDPPKNTITGMFEGSITLETAENNQQVPEPSSLLFLAFGIAGLAGIRKKF